MNTPRFQTVCVAADGPIATLTLNRPDQRNALSVRMLGEIRAAARWFDDQQTVRAVIVSGAGKAFCAGADLAEFVGDGDATLRWHADAGRLMAEAVEQMRAVTVAAIHGWCVGGGLVLAAACDLRVAGEASSFSIPEVKLGIPLAWGGIPRLLREMGPAVVKELVMTARPFSATEARAIGFLNRVVADDAVLREARTLAEVIASKPRRAIEVTKRHVDAVSAQMTGLGGAWADADSLVAALFDEEASAARRRYLAERGR